MKVSKASVNESTPLVFDPDVAFLHRGYGRVLGFYVKKGVEVDESETFNAIRGIVSLFQYQSGDMAGPEVDVSGECDVVYAADRHGVHKRKSACRRHQFRGRQQKIVDVTRDYDFKALYKLNNEVIDEVEAVETFSSFVTLKKEVGWKATVKQQLVLKGKQQFIRFTAKKLTHDAKIHMSTLTTSGRLLRRSSVETITSSNI